MAFFSKDRSFIDNLPRIYALYTGGFLAFIGLMAVGEQMGMKDDTIGIMFVGFTIVIYALIGWLSRTMQIDAYYVAGRQVPPVFNGMATGADWMSGASFVAMAGGIYMGGHAYLAFVVGWTGGYVLLALPAALATYAGRTGGTGPAGHFLSGAFATLLATPCSAPFLGTAVGFALARGAGEIYAVFVALGLGMALPYLAVAAMPDANA